MACVGGSIQAPVIDTYPRRLGLRARQTPLGWQLGRDFRLSIDSLVFRWLAALPPNSVPGLRLVVGLFPGLEPRWAFIPPDLFDGCEPFVDFMSKNLALRMKKPDYLPGSESFMGNYYTLRFWRLANDR